MLTRFEHYAKPALRKWAKFTFDAKTRSRLYRKVAAQLDNGVKLRVVIQDLYDRAAKRGETETMTIILADVRHALDRGEGLAHALTPWSDPLECMVIGAGEKSGNIGPALRQAAESLSGVKEMQKAVLNSLSYPTVLLIATIGVLYYIGTEFLPEMTAIASADQFTGTAASLYWFSDFVQTPWFWLCILAIIGIIGGVIYTLPRTFGEDRFRVHLDKIPPWSLYRLVIGSGFLVSLSSLLRAGIKLEDAIIQANKYASPYLSIRLNAILIESRKGRSFGDALEATRYQFPDRDIIDDLITYSALPNFDQILFNYGQEWTEEGIESIKEQAVILQGVAFLVMATVIGWLVTGVMDIQTQLGAVLQQIN